MKWLNRACLNICSHKIRNLILVLMFSVLFSVFLVVFVCWTSADKEMNFLQQNLGNAVLIVRPIAVNPGQYGFFSEDEILQLKDNSHVRAYNAVSWKDMELIESSPFIKDPEGHEKYRQRLQQRLEAAGITGADENCKAVGVTDSEKINFFTGGDFELIAGEPILPTDAGKAVVLVSRDIAEVNGWKIGDKVTAGLSDFEKSMGHSGEALTLEIKGMFSYKALGASEVRSVDYPANYLFVPEGVLKETYSVAPVFVYAYIDSIKEISSFVSEMQGIWGIESVDTENVLCRYEYKWDEDWFESVSLPLSQLGRISNGITFIVLISLLGATALITALVIREKQYEYAIYLSMGESKAMLVLQTVCEMMLVLVTSAAVGIFVTGMLMEPVSSQIMRPYAELNNAALQQKKDADKLDRDENTSIEYRIKENSVLLRETKSSLSFFVTFMERCFFAFILFVIIPVIIIIQCALCLGAPYVAPKRFR